MRKGDKEQWRLPIRILVVLLVLVCAAGFTGKEVPDSLENKDYAVTLGVGTEQGDTESRYTFAIAKLDEYKGSSQEMLDTEVYSCKAKSVEAAMAEYKKEKHRRLSIRHLQKVVIETDDIEQIMLELLPYCNTSDSVRVVIADDVYPVVKRDDNGTVGFRKLIRNIYKGENSY